MTRRRLVLACWSVTGITAIGTTIRAADMDSPAAAWALAIVLAALAFVTFALVLRPRLRRASGTPASEAPSFRAAALGALIGVGFVVLIGSSPAGVVFVSVGFGGTLGFFLWTPTLTRGG